MEQYKREFIEFLQSAGVLKFGDFTAKSGRKIPYFINAGEIKTGEHISKLGEFYAKAYIDKVGNLSNYSDILGKIKCFKYNAKDFVWVYLFFLFHVNRDIESLQNTF